MGRTINVQALIKNKKRVIKLNRNNLFVLDTLMNDGSQKKFLDSHKKKRFSEYSGFIDIFKSKVIKLVVNTSQGREDKDDTTILLPNDPPDIKNYEYIFHTHPPTPFIGSRIPQGILYEFPSIADLYHFSYYHNNGLALGSIIMTPEGLYIIYATDQYKHTKITYPKREDGEMLEKIQFKIQDLAIKKYHEKFSIEYFYSTISQDRLYYKMFKKAVGKYFKNQITLSYIPRRYDETIGKWIIESLSLKY